MTVRREDGDMENVPLCKVCNLPLDMSEGAARNHRRHETCLQAEKRAEWERELERRLRDNRPPRCERCGRELVYVPPYLEGDDPREWDDEHYFCRRCGE